LTFIPITIYADGSINRSGSDEHNIVNADSSYLAGYTWVGDGMSTIRFDEFWKLYPNRVNKKKAKELWSKQNCDDVAESILGHLTTRVKTDKKWLEGYIIGPEVFIRGERWTDEYEEAKPKFNRYEPSTTIVDESIAGEGLLGSARALNVAIKDDAGVPFTTEQLSRLIWCKDWMKRGIPVARNVHMTQLPEAFHKYFEGVGVPF